MPFKSMLPALTTLPLFYQIKSEDILALLSCMGASLKTFKKGEFLVSEGQDMTGLLILLKGQALLYKNTDASSSLLGAAPEGHVLGAASIGRDIIPSLMSAKAAVSCTALFVPYRRLMFQCSKRCPFHRLLALLQETAAAAGTRTFTLPYGRTELAHYLCADRSALTRELNHMQKKGILSFSGNTYTLLP